MTAPLWRVLPHRPIEKLSSRVWRVEGDLPNMPLKRVMTVLRQADGKLVVHNGIALEDASMRELDAWGEVATILVPNGYHRMDAPAYAARYPRARVLAPEGSLTKVRERVPTAEPYGSFSGDGSISLSLLDGVGQAEGFVRIEDESGVTLVLNDAVFNMPHCGGVHGFVLKHLTQSSGGPRVSRVGKLFLVKDKAAFVAQLEALARTPGLARVIVSHHEVLTGDPAGALRQAAATVA